MKRPLIAVFALALTVATSLRAQEATPVDRALEQIEAGKIEDAIATLESIEQSDPVRALLGALYLENGRPGDARALLGPLAASPSADPGVLYNAGRAALAMRDFPAAEELLNRSVELAPGSPASRELGRMLAYLGRCGDAYRHLQPWARANPEDLDARISAARCALDLERGPEAEELLSGIPQEPAIVKVLWGRLLLLKGDPWGALSMLEPIAENPPANLERQVRRVMADGYLTVGQAASAVELLEGQTGDDPSMALILSSAHYQSGDLDASIAAIEPAAMAVLQAVNSGEIPADPSLASAIALEYGRLMVLSGRNEEALAPLSLVAQLSPDAPIGWQLLAQALSALGRTEEAETATERFEAVSALGAGLSLDEQEMKAADPTGREIRRGFVLARQGALSEALQIARDEIVLAPGDHRPHLLEALALLMMERPTEALESAEQALKLAPDNADAHYQRGIVHLALGNSELAEVDLRKTIAIAPDHTAAMNDLAIALLSEGNEEEARQLLERVLELRPDDPVAADNLARISGSGG